MKAVFSLVIVILALVSGKSLKKNFHESRDVVEIIKFYGYPVETHEVITDDGYILQLFRIRGGRHQHHQQQQQPEEQLRRQSEEDERTTERNVETRRPVLLFHDMLSSCIDFVVGGPTEGLAFVLADKGYDVYLGNARGTIFGRKHTTLNPDKDAIFWNFCFDQIGTKDLPAIVNKVIAVSGKPKIQFIGHNEGNTAFYIMNSEKPEYNVKFERAISLGPMAYMKNSHNEIIKKVVEHVKEKTWVMKHVGISTLNPSHELLEEVTEKCKSEVNKKLCDNFYFLYYGYQSQQLNMTTVSNLLREVPSSGTVKEMIHLAQMKYTGRFQKYQPIEQDIDEDIQEYDLSRVSVPVAMLYTSQDKLSAIEDVEKLMKKLPHVMEPYRFEHLTNNLDLMFSHDVMNVYHVILKYLRGDVQEMRKPIN